MKMVTLRIRIALAAGLATGWICAAGAQETSVGEPLPVRYAWSNVVIGGGGFVTGIICHPHRKDLIYARTDVGGAYRWDAAGQRWIPITDWIGVEDVNLTGIESLALDPSDPNRVYLAAGTYTPSKAAMLRSDDQGKTFKRSEVPFAMGANESGRGNGERLAVDPNQGEILFFGSRLSGLWKSTDRGATWKKVEGFPNLRSDQEEADASGVATNARPRRRFGQEQVGIVCVVFDPAGGRAGSATPDIYAAASTTGTNLFRSSDAGASWLAVSNQPVGLRPNHMVRAPDGLFYLSYGKEPGPNSMSDGAVWKFNPRNGVWTDITPVKPAAAGQPFGYGAVAVDAKHPSTLMVTTFCHWDPHDEIYRSTNGGASWTQIWQDNTQWDHSKAPYTRSRTPHWLSDIEINPCNPDQVLITTGYGIWGCVNATEADAGRPTRWVFLDEGLEETVPLGLISPPAGAHLLSGVGDIDGFRHDDLTVSPPSTFAGPLYGNTESIAFAGQRPEVIVRTGTTRERQGGPSRGAFSLDGGRTWAALATEPTGSAGAGAVAISADGRTMVWTPRRSGPHYSANHGTNWTACAGLAAGLRVVADGVNPSRFYAYDSRNGTLLVSADAAASFAETRAPFRLADGFDRGFGGPGGEWGMLYSTPDRQGDLWLAFQGGNLCHSTNGGVSFVKIPGVEEAHSLGFGKAAPGGSYPSLYLAGRRGRLTALFRSDDAGQTWARINDDQHQFGWINHVTGDPRIYGRVYFATAGRGIIYGDPEPLGE